MLGKLLGKKNWLKRSKNKLISLGYNCEISFQIQKFRKPFESSLFSWVYSLNNQKFINALWNLDDIFTDQIHFHLPTDNMFYDEKYDLVFHGKTNKKEMLDETGNIINQKNYDACVDELKSRLKHLKEKFRKDFVSDYEKIYFRKIEIYPDWVNEEFYKEIIQFIKDLHEYFKEKVKTGGFKLIIVLEERYSIPEIKELECDTLFIRTVRFYAPYDNTKDGADYESWRKILEEFGD